MTVTHIHPEHLLERRWDELSAAERQQLDDAAATCPVCALEVGARRELAAAASASAGDELLLDRLVAGLDLEVPATAQVDADGADPTPTIDRRRRRAVGLGLAAVMLVTAASAAAISVLGGLGDEPEPEPEPSGHVQSPAPSVVPSPPPSPAEPVVGEDAREDREAAPPPVPAERPPRVRRPEPTAGDLLRVANEARRDGRHREAARGYVRLQTRFPDSREATLSRVTYGRLLLDRLGEPAKASRQFESYLRSDPQGTLAEEARVGRALSLRRLDDREAEREAWQELLARHPRTAHADRARARLRELR